MGSPLLVSRVQEKVSLAPYTTLRSGGAAQWFLKVRSVEEFAAVAIEAQHKGVTTTVLGWGSNVLPSDDGVPGLTILNAARQIEFGPDGAVSADCGCGFQELFLKTAQHGLLGLEFAVGIPGTLGGALVSNAGAYRSNVSEFLTELEVIHNGERRMVPPSFMEFSYRDSRIRRASREALVLLRVVFQLPKGVPRAIYDEARDYQRQRISKQPPPASAGSFFKNVNDPQLAASLTRLPEKLRQAGVVPAGFLIQETGLPGTRHKGAMIARRHANFIVNVGGAKAFAIRELADKAKAAVHDRFGVHLEEEVLYLGDWRRYSEADL